MGPKLDFDTARAQERCWPARWMLLGANLVSINAPRLCKLVHIELELAVTSHGVVTLVPIVVTAKATETAAQVWSGYNLDKAVTIPCDLQTWNGKKLG